MCSFLLLLPALAVRAHAQVQVAQLTAHDAALQDGFGIVAISGDWILAGSPCDDDLGPGSGSVYFFQRSGTTWVEQQKVYASDPVSSSFFGGSVALEDSVAVVGASCALDATGTFRPGAAYVFELDSISGQWIERFRLAALDGASADMFGDRVAIAGTTILVSSTEDDNDRGSTYVFTRTGASWSQQAKLIGSDSSPGDRFGLALAVRGNRVVVGAPLQPDPTFRGAAYVFSRTGTTWQEDTKLSPSDPSDFDNFGSALAIGESQIVVGSPQDDGQGAFYVFENVGPSWTETAKHQSPTAASIGAFGFGIDIDTEFLLVGAPGERTGGILTGVGHLYRRSGQFWSYWSRLEVMPAVFGAERGTFVGIDGEDIVLGAPREDHSGIVQAGAVWVFDAIDSTPTSYCSAKTTSRSCLPFMTSLGEPSASGGPFLVQGNDHVEGQAGLLLYSFKKSSLAFHGGTLCIKAPFRRLGTLVKATDGVLCTSCAGNCRTLSRNFNQYVQTGADPMLTAGQRVNVQWRQRDPSEPLGFGDNLSDGLSFAIGL